MMELPLFTVLRSPFVVCRSPAVVCHAVAQFIGFWLLAFRRRRYVSAWPAKPFVIRHLLFVIAPARSILRASFAKNVLWLFVESVYSPG